MDRLFILAAAIVIAGFLSGGIYTAAGDGHGGTYIVNRYTAGTWSCSISCARMKFRDDNN